MSVHKYSKTGMLAKYLNLQKIKCCSQCNWEAVSQHTKSTSNRCSCTLCYLFATQEIKVSPVCPLDSSYTIMDLPLLHRDINPISRCPSSEHAATHWLLGGFVSWNNARNRLTLLITAGGNFTSTQTLHSLLQSWLWWGFFGLFFFLCIRRQFPPQCFPHYL